MKIKVDKPGTAIQQRAVEQHLEALGLTLDDERNLTPEAIERAGGIDALERVKDDDGRIDLAALAKLRHTIGGTALAAVDPGHALSSATLAATGLTKTLTAQVVEGLDPIALASVTRRANHLLAQLAPVTDSALGSLSAIEPAVIDALADATKDLAKQATDYLTHLSKARSEQLTTLKTALRTLNDAAVSPDDRDRAQAELTTAETMTVSLATATTVVDALLKAADGLAAQQIEKTFQRHLASQLETRQPRTDADLDYVVAHAAARTQSLFGTELSAADQTTMVAEPFDRLAEHDVVAVRSRIAAGGLDLGAVPPASAYQQAALTQPAGDLAGRMAALLAAEPADGEALIAAFESVPGLRDLFCEWAGVGEGFSIRTHTLMVYEQLNSQFRHFGLDDIEMPQDVSLRRMFNGLIGLHDIGKSVAIEEGDKHRQHEFTTPIIKHTLAQAGLTPTEIALAANLVDNDILGDVVKRDSKKATKEEPQEDLDTTAAYERVCTLASEVSMNPDDYFKLQAFFYTVDASSYAFLRKHVFDDHDGKMVPKSKSFAALERRVFNG